MKKLLNYILLIVFTLMMFTVIENKWYYLVYSLVILNSLINIVLKEDE